MNTDGLTFQLDQGYSQSTLSQPPKWWMVEGIISQLSFLYQIKTSLGNMKPLTENKQQQLVTSMVKP